MKKLDETFIKEIYQLIKSLINFCNYDIELKKGELKSLTVHQMILVKTIIFLRDNPIFEYGMSN